MSEQADEGVEVQRSIILSRVTALVSAAQEVSRAVNHPAAAAKEMRARLLSIGYPNYLPTVDQLVLDLMEWRDRLQVESPAPPPVCACGEPATTKDPWGGADACGECGRGLWSEYYERHEEMRYKYTLDGALIDIVDFLNVNETVEGDDLLKIHSMRRGEAIQFGGGAFAHFTLARVS